MSPLSVFRLDAERVFKHRFAVQITVDTLVGGVPSDPDVAASWIKTKLGDRASDEIIAEEVAAVLKARGTDFLGASEQDKAAAAEEVNRRRHLTGFKRDYDTELARVLQKEAISKGMDPADAARLIGELYVDGRQAKAMLKEAANIAVGSGQLSGRGWGKTNKGLLSFLAEHVFVPDNKIYLGVTEATGINQSFVHTWRGSGIKLEEYVRDAVPEFTVVTDWDFSDEEWATIWVTAERNGLGASRSQGFGTFAVTKWRRLSNKDGSWKKGVAPADAAI